MLDDRVDMSRTGGCLAGEDWGFQVERQARVQRQEGGGGELCKNRKNKQRLFGSVGPNNSL